MNRLNGARTTRRYVQVCVTHHEIEEGWAAFRHVRCVCSYPDMYWLRSTITPVGVTAVFERI